MSPICQNQILSVMSLVLTTNLNFSLKFLAFNEIVSSIKILYLDDTILYEIFDLYVFSIFKSIFIYILNNDENIIFRRHNI